MSIALPAPVAAYFSGNERLDVAAMLAPFDDVAVVADDGHTHRGRAAIRAWIEEATVGNQAIATPQSVTTDGGEHAVLARVAGQFRGSPVSLTFRFTLAGDRITRLEIR